MTSRHHWYRDENKHPFRSRVRSKTQGHSCPDCPDCDHYRALDSLLSLPVMDTGERAPEGVSDIQPDEDLSDEAVSWWRKLVHGRQA